MSSLLIHLEASGSVIIVLLWRLWILVFSETGAHRRFGDITIVSGKDLHDAFVLAK